jgi:hypothetical protein
MRQPGLTRPRDTCRQLPGRRPLLARARTAAAGRVARQAAVLAGYLAAGVALTWPLTARLPGRLPAVRDVASYIWALWWVPHQLVHLADPWYTAHLAAPAGIPLGFDTLMPLAGLALAPVTLTLGPVASYSVLVIVLPGLAGYLMYRAALLWLPGQPGALAAGAFFGLSAMLTWQDWYHVNLAAGELFLPLALLAAVRLARAPGPARALALGLVLGAAALVNQESAVLAGLLAALTLVPWLARRPSFTLAKLRYCGLGLVAAGLVASPQFTAMLWQAGTGDAVAPAAALASSYRKFGVGLPAMVAPSPSLGRFGLGSLASAYHYLGFEGVATFGVTMAALALAGLAVSWRRRSARLLALLWLGTAVLALGAALHVGGRVYTPLAQSRAGVQVSGLLPFTWFVQLPGLGAFREADRFALLGLVPAALLAGSAVAWLAARARPAVAGPALAVLAGLAVLEAGWAGGGHFPKTMPGALPAIDRPITADHSGSVVVDVPFGLWGGLPAHFGEGMAPPALVMATADGHPRAESYSSWVPHRLVARLRRDPFYSRLAAAQRGRPSSRAQLTAARADATRLRVGWAVVWQRSPAVAGYLRGTGFRFRDRVGRVWIYRLPPRGPGQPGR